MLGYVDEYQRKSEPRATRAIKSVSMGGVNSWHLFYLTAMSYPSPQWHTTKTDLASTYRFMSSTPEFARLV